MRLHRRRTLWLTIALLLVVVGGVWLLASRSRITQANFDRIHLGMAEQEVTKILGGYDVKERTLEAFFWFNGRNAIFIQFQDGKVKEKQFYRRTMLDIFEWYAKKSAAKFGISTD